MTTRPITFPKTSDGVWTNRETGVRIKRNDILGGYYVLVGNLPSDYERVGFHVDYSRLPQALAAAKVYVAEVARPAIAEAYDEAMAEHIDRAEEASRERTNQLTPFIRRCGELRRAGAADFREAKRMAIHEAHAEALTEDAAWMIDAREADHAEALVYSWRKPVAVDPDASMEAHYDAEMEARHPSWPTRAQLKPWESLDSTADRVIESMTPIAGTTDAPLCLRMTGVHIQHMTADPNDPTCRDTADLHPVDEPTPMTIGEVYAPLGMTPAAMRDRGLIGPYLWADENPYENALGGQ